MWEIFESRRVVKLIQVVVSFLIVAAVLTNAFAIQLSLKTQTDQREGRQVAIETTCATLGAVVDAGRETLLASARGPRPSRYALNLRRLGRPPLKDRLVTAELAADTYARLIASRVERLTGRRDLVRKNGTLDCNRLKKATKTEG